MIVSIEYFTNSLIYINPLILVDHSPSHNLTNCEIECKDECVRTVVKAKIDKGGGMMAA